MRVEQLLERLESVTGGEGQWHARCPAHDDRQASLTVGLGREGRILLTCWAGCELEAIAAGAGVKVGDLFQRNGGTAPWGPGALGKVETDFLPDPADLGRHVAALLASAPTRDAIFELKGWRAETLAAIDVGLQGTRLTIPMRTLGGELVNLLRYWPAAKPKMLSLRGRPRVPLYLLLPDEPVWIVEGETDAIAMAMMGLSSIGAPGASAKARPEWLAPVRDRNVYVCMDVDEPGRKAAARWAAAALETGAASVRVVELEGPKGYDVGEVLLEHRDEPEVARRLLQAAAVDAPLYEVPTVTFAEPTTNGAVINGKPGDVLRRNLRDVRPERVHMRWRDRIPVGRVGIVFGPPGQGKSTLIALVSADVTGTGGRVLLASAEDDPSTTLVPRMAAAGADVGLVDLLSTQAAKGETSLVLPRDLDTLGAHMRGAALLIIDPLIAHLGDDINSWREQDVRAQVLAPLAYFARETGCSVVLVMHMNKSATNSTDPLMRISGSGGFGGAARFALLLGSHPDDVGLDESERRLVLVHVKASETRRQMAMVFRRRTQGVDLGAGMSTVPVLELVDDLASISAEAVLEHTDPDEAGAFSEAIEYLRAELVDGPKLAKRTLQQARERGDFSERTLRKAKRALGIRSWRDSDGWWWEKT